jgi:hypothetical protein
MAGFAHPQNIPCFTCCKINIREPRRRTPDFEGLRGISREGSSRDLEGRDFEGLRANSRDFEGSGYEGLRGSYRGETSKDFGRFRGTSSSNCCSAVNLLSW